jgi:FMN phosphatase YigB (HAD superfamily)
VTRAMLFDLGNVLVAFDFRRGYEAIRPYCRVPPEEIQPRITQSGLVPPYERGKISSQEFFERLAAALQMQVSYEEFCRLWSTIFLPDVLVPEAMLQGLRQRYRMVLISNTNDIHYRDIASRYAIVKHFDAHVLSYEVGAAKPEDHIYREAIRQAGCAPEECLYIDDIPEFIAAGRRHGLAAVQFQNAVELKAEFRRRGVVWG